MVDKDLLKHSNPVNTCITSPNYISYYSLPLNICKYLICQIYQLQCNRLKNCTHVPFNVDSLDSAAPYPLDMVPRKNWVGKLTFSILALNLNICFPLTNK